MILNIRIDHKTADIRTIEKSTRQMDEVFLRIKKEYVVEEHIQIKTCNRAEIYIVLEDINLDDPDFDAFVIETDDDAIKHLLKLACGIESMIIGEDQILGQIKAVSYTHLRAHET